MTPAEDLAVVRARLEHMVTLAKAARIEGRENFWYEADEPWMRDLGSEDAAFIAAANPDLLLRVAREALGVLNRHGADCIDCGVFDRCPEVDGVLRAWKP